MIGKTVGKLSFIALLGIAVSLWGAPIAGQAQPVQSVTSTQGALLSVDLANGTITVETHSGPKVFQVTSLTTVHVGHETATTIAALPAFVGAQAIVLSAAATGSSVAGSIDLLVFPASGTTGSGSQIDRGDGHSGGS